MTSESSREMHSVNFDEVVCKPDIEIGEVKVQIQDVKIKVNDQFGIVKDSKVIIMDWECSLPKQKHTDGTAYQCTHCDRSFSRNGNYLNHLKTHTGGKPHQCSQCP
ncbi:unnamed protein product, partial [Meganyctiphanes norvegica]